MTVTLYGIPRDPDHASSQCNAGDVTVLRATTASCDEHAASGRDENA